MAIIIPQGGGGTSGAKDVIAVPNQAGRLAVADDNGQVVKQADNGITYIQHASPASNNANWTPVASQDEVLEATADLSGAVPAGISIGVNKVNGKLFYRNNSDQWAEVVGGERSKFRGDWVQASTYLAGDMVRHTNKLYVANAAIPANTAFAAGTSGATWLEIAGGERSKYRGDWVQAQAYQSEDMVLRNNLLYKANGAIAASTAFAEGTTGATWLEISRSPYRGPWVISNAYKQGDMVYYQGDVYVANADVNVNTAFTVGTTGSTWKNISETAMSVSRIVVQNGHGFVVGQPIRATAENTYEAALAGTPNKESFGVVTQVISANVFRITSNGLVKASGHGFADGKTYWLPAAAGVATATQPTAGVVQALFTVVDADHLQVFDRQAFNVAAPSAPASSSSTAAGIKSYIVSSTALRDQITDMSEGDLCSVLINHEHVTHYRGIYRYDGSAWQDWVLDDVYPYMRHSSFNQPNVPLTLDKSAPGRVYEYFGSLETNATIEVKEAPGPSARFMLVQNSSDFNLNVSAHVTDADNGYIGPSVVRPGETLLVTDHHSKSRAVQGVIIGKPEKQYKTTEVDTGEKWINGKPIFERVFDLTGMTDGDETILTGVETLIENHGRVKSGTGTEHIRALGYYASETDHFYLRQNHDGTVTRRFNASAAGATIGAESFILVRYTKV